MSTPYKEGEAAYPAGPRNPYPIGSREYDEWNEGWDDAEYEDNYWDDYEDEDEY